MQIVAELDSSRSGIIEQKMTTIRAPGVNVLAIRTLAAWSERVWRWAFNVLRSIYTLISSYLPASGCWLIVQRPCFRVPSNTAPAPVPTPCASLSTPPLLWSGATEASRAMLPWQQASGFFPTLNLFRHNDDGVSKHLLHLDFHRAVSCHNDVCVRKGGASWRNTQRRTMRA